MPSSMTKPCALPAGAGRVVTFRCPIDLDLWLAQESEKLEVNRTAVILHALDSYRLHHHDSPNIPEPSQQGVGAASL